jgi:3-hydroxyisobutyrate dehydrogenase
VAKIGFLGLGNMGAPMVENLIEAGHIVHIYDVLPELRAPLVALGAIDALTPLEATRDVDIVITMLPSGAIVRQVYEGPTGIFNTLDCRGLLFIDCSTIAPDDARALAAGATRVGAEMIDAPVSGGVRGAIDGTLTFIVGGSSQTLEKARPVLENMGRAIFHVGEHGAGQTAKICNNMMTGILMAGTAEALALGVRNGLDPGVLSDVMRKSTGANFVVERWNPWPGVDQNSPASKGYAGGFKLGLLLKDLDLAIQSAQSSKAAVPLGSAARNLFQIHALGAVENVGMDMSIVQSLYYPISIAESVQQPALMLPRGN